MSKNINIEVTGLIANATGAPVIVCGNSGYQVKFTFDADWADITAKTARFVYVQDGEVKYHDAPFTGDTVDVPVLSNTKEVRVGVYAGEFSTSTPACVPCLLSIRCGSGTLADQPLTPSQYDEIMALFNDLPSESVGIPDGSIGTAKLANGAVTTEKIAMGSVTAEKLADDVVFDSEPADGSIGTAKLANGAVNAEKLADAAIDREGLFSFGLIEKFLSLPKSTVTSAGAFGASYFDALTDPGIYEMGSQAGEQYVLIVLKPETDYQRMQIRLSYDKIEYRGIYTDEAGVFNSEDWEPWVDLTGAAEKNNVLYVSMPDYVNVKTNNTFKIYYRNILSRDDVILWVGYNSNLTTRYYDDYLSIIATSEGTHTLPWKVYDKGHNLLDSGELRVIATAKVPSETTKAIVIGDSTVNAGTMTAKAAELYSADGATLMLLGTRGDGTHEGRGGWTAKMYCTVASNGGISNPFYNNGFDFSYYMNNQNYSGVQAVVIQLGINDIFAFKDYDWALYDSTETLDYINQIVTSILAYDSSIKVIVNLPTTPNSNGTSFTEAYGTTQLYSTYNRNIIRFAEELKDYYANNPNVTISASNCVLDTKTQISDGVHPTTEGYNELGERLYEVLVSVTDGGVYIVPLLDITQRTRVQHTGATLSATSTRDLDVTKCYDGVFNGTRVENVVITAYTALSANSLSIQVSTAGGTGMEFPVTLEVGKSYTLKYTVNNTGRVYVMKYNSDTTYNANEMLSSTAGSYTKTITPEDGFIYSIIFVPMVKDTLVTFSDISLTEN